LPRGSYDRLAQSAVPLQRAKLARAEKMIRGFYFACLDFHFAVTHRIGGEHRPAPSITRLGPVSLSLTSPDRMCLISLAFLVIPHHTHRPCSTHLGAWVGPPSPNPPSSIRAPAETPTPTHSPRPLQTLLPSAMSTRGVLHPARRGRVRRGGTRWMRKRCSRNCCQQQSVQRQGLADS
jgi:hypothetical protein